MFRPTDYFIEILKEGAYPATTVGKCYNILQYLDRQKFKRDDDGYYDILVNLPESANDRFTASHARTWKRVYRPVKAGDMVLINNPDEVSKATGKSDQIFEVALVTSTGAVRVTTGSGFYAEEFIVVEDITKQTKESVKMTKFYAKRTGETNTIFTKGAMYEVKKVNDSETFSKMEDGDSFHVVSDNGRLVSRKYNSDIPLFEIHVEVDGVVRKMEDVSLKEEAEYVPVSPRRKAVEGDMIVIKIDKDGFVGQGIKAGTVVEALNPDSAGDIDRVKYNGIEKYLPHSYLFYNVNEYDVVEEVVKTNVVDMWVKSEDSTTKRITNVRALVDRPNFEKGKVYSVREFSGTNFDNWFTEEGDRKTYATGWITKDHYEHVELNMKAVEFVEKPWKFGGRKYTDGQYVRINSAARLERFGVGMGDILQIVNGGQDGTFDRWINLSKGNSEGYHSSGFITRTKYTIVEPKLKQVNTATVEAATAELQRVMDANSAYTFHFVVKADKREVTCVRKQNGTATNPIGVAKCAPNDVFVPEIGKVIAMYRAMGMTVPEKFVKEESAPDTLKVPTVGDYVKVIKNSNLHNYKIGSIVKLVDVHPDTDREGVFIAEKRNGINGNYIRIMDVEVSTKDEFEAQAERATVGDYVKAVVNFGGVKEGDVLKITTDDGTDVPYKAEKKNGSKTGWFKEEQVEKITKAMYDELLKIEVGDYVKVTEKANGHNYEVGTIVKVLRVYEDGTFRCQRPDGSEGNYIHKDQLELTTKEEHDRQVPRLTVGDYVKVLNNSGGHNYEVGSIVKIVKDDRDDSPYKGVKANGTLGNWLRPADIERATKEAFESQEGFTKRPTVGDTVRVISSGSIGTVRIDDHDGQPYRLTIDGADCGWFDETEIELVEDIVVNGKYQVQVEVIETSEHMVKLKIGAESVWLPKQVVFENMK